MEINNLALSSLAICSFMKKVGKWALMFCLLMSLVGCSQKHDHKGKTPLVEVGGKFLYQEDLQAALPLNLSADDSVLFAESYIRNWVEDALLFEKAEDNIRDGEKVKALVESYRKALVVHAYQEELVKQQLAEEIAPSEIADYYEKNKSLFTECSRFTLDTGLRSANLAAISDNRATYLLKDSLSTILYTYDFEKMERYIIDLTSYGREYGYYGAGDNILLHQPAGKSGMYIIPELGEMPINYSSFYNIFAAEIPTVTTGD